MFGCHFCKKCGGYIGASVVVAGGLWPPLGEPVVEQAIERMEMRACQCEGQTKNPIDEDRKKAPKQSDEPYQTPARGIDFYATAVPMTSGSTLTTTTTTTTTRGPLLGGPYGGLRL
jgi:hypothetical protein